MYTNDIYVGTYSMCTYFDYKWYTQYCIFTIMESAQRGKCTVYNATHRVQFTVYRTLPHVGVIVELCGPGFMIHYLQN
jgi:hypothetical protein